MCVVVILIFTNFCHETLNPLPLGESNNLAHIFCSFSHTTLKTQSQFALTSYIEYWKTKWPKLLSSQYLCIVCCNWHSLPYKQFSPSRRTPPLLETDFVIREWHTFLYKPFLFLCIDIYFSRNSINSVAIYITTTAQSFILQFYFPITKTC